MKFLVRLGETLRGLSDTGSIVTAAAEAVGLRLGAARVGYAEVTPGGDALSIRPDWTAGGLPSLAGQSPGLDAFCAGRAEDLRLGRSLHLTDGETAMLIAPLVRDGGLAALLYLHAPASRLWKDGDLALAEVVAERLWDALERTRAQAALRESEARFRAMADSAPAPVWVTSARGGIEFVNKAFIEMTGVSREDSRGDIWLSLMHPDDLQRVVAQRTEAWIDHSPYVFEARFRAQDGRWLWMQAHSKPRFDGTGAFQGYVGLAIDQTEARAAAEALRESEELFRIVAECAPVMLWMSGPDGQCIYMNPAQLSFFGLDTPPAWVDVRALLHPDDAREAKDVLKTARAARSGFSTEGRIRRADGAWRLIRTEARARPSRDGAYLGLVGVSADITDARQVEQDLKNVNELLADRMAAALADKEQAEAALFHAQKLEAVGRLTGGVAHDFNNLLTVVIGSLDLALKKPADIDRTVRMMQAAMTAARRGERLTDQLLSFSRRQALRPQACDLNVLIRESEPLLRRAIGEAVQVTFAFAPGQLGAFVDSGQFVAGLLNLAVNARDATPDGGEIVVETGRRTLSGDEAVAGGPRRCVYIRVRDTGSGMDEDVLKRAFEPFFTTKPVGKGTGLGLSQIYGFAHQSGGGASIRSRPGEGTTVEIYLPESQVPEDAAQATAAVVDSGARLRILLVEDDLPVGAVAEEMLTEMGHSVVRAHRPEDALARLADSGHFDLLLTDLVMPGPMNGVDLARACVARQPGLPVLIASGYVADDGDNVLSGVSWPLLRKPYSAAEVAAALQGLSPRQTTPA